MTTVEALKELAAVVVGGITAADVPGTSIPEVIMYIAENYPTAEQLGTLTVTSVPGSAEGKTAITVAPVLTSGNTYVYLTSPTTIATPAYLDPATGYTAWNGVNDIAAEDGHHIAICEVNSSNQIVKFGQAVVVVNLG